MSETILILILICIILLLLYNLHFKIPNSEGYLVRNLNDKKQAADMLAELNNNLRKVVYYINFKLKNCKNKSQLSTQDKYILEYEQYIKRINGRIDDVTIKESPPNSEYTSYSINKGEELVFCIRSKKTNQLHNMNVLMYVALHELAHIGCPEVGHTELFNKINIFLLKQAIEIGVYRYENYDASPIEYCGMNLNTTVLN